MFSITTMASSTTNPVAIVRAIMDKLSMLYLHKYMMANVPIKETGTATLGIRVARTLRRKRKTTKMTSPIDMASVRSTSFTDARMVVVRSSITVKSIAAGMEAFKEGMDARMRSTVSMIWAPGCREIIYKMAGFPFTTPGARTFSTESPTSEKTDGLTAKPLSYRAAI